MHFHYTYSQVLLDNGADINSVNIHGEPLLTSAVNSRNPRTVQILTNNHYNINWKAGDAQVTG